MSVLHGLPLVVLLFSCSAALTNVPVTYISPNNASLVISSLEFPDLGSPDRSRPFTIHVEGIVGTGKTTMLGAFIDYPGMDILPEPVENWTNLNGTDVLNLFFSNPKRWGPTMESLTYNSMMNEHLRKFGLIKAMERSIHSARLCFAETSRREGMMSDPEFAILDYWYKFLTNKEAKYPSGLDTDADLIVYLQISPEAALDRIKMRGRPEEANVQLSYLQHLKEAHDDWLLRGKSGYPIPAKRIIVMSTEHHLEDMMKIYRQLADKIWSSFPQNMKATC